MRDTARRVAQKWRNSLLGVNGGDGAACRIHRKIDAFDLDFFVGAQIR